jgi:hypothetical protein
MLKFRRQDQGSEIISIFGEFAHGTSRGRLEGGIVKIFEKKIRKSSRI